MKIYALRAKNTGYYLSINYYLNMLKDSVEFEFSKSSGNKMIWTTTNKDKAEKIVALSQECKYGVKYDSCGTGSMSSPALNYYMGELEIVELMPE